MLDFVQHSVLPAVLEVQYLRGSIFNSNLKNHENFKNIQHSNAFLRR